MKKTSEERRYRDPLFEPEFIVADCSKERLVDKYKNPQIQFDLCSCQFSFHYSFESLSQAELMLQNAVENLKPGGYFIGTTPNSYEIVRRLQEAEGLSFGNEVFNISAETKDSFPLFGSKYNFHLEGVVDCPEFLVYFPLLEKMCEKYNLRLVYRKTFSEFFADKSKESAQLLYRMQALETYPPKKEGVSLVSNAEDAYTQAKECLEASSSSGEKDDKAKESKYVGTLSKAEWEAAGMYIVFAFEKIDFEAEKRKEEEKQRREEEEKKRKAAEEKRREEAEKKKEEEAEKKMEQEAESRKRKHEDDEAAAEPPVKKDKAAEEAVSEEQPAEEEEKMSEEQATSSTEQETQETEQS